MPRDVTKGLRPHAYSQWSSVVELRAEEIIHALHGAATTAPATRRDSVRVSAHPVPATMGGVSDININIDLDNADTPIVQGSSLVEFGPDLVGRLSDRDLADMIVVLIGEQSRRALERADVGALIEEGFKRGFEIKGVTDPWLDQGILVAPGMKIDRSNTTHTCTFVRVDQRWVWEANDRIEDVVRHVPGPRSQMRSITLVAAPEGTTVDRISSKARNGVHELVEVRSYVVRGSELELVSARAIGPTGHR